MKDLRKTGKIAGIVHKNAISKEQVKKLFESGELGPADSLNPAQLQRTAWFSWHPQCFLYEKLHKGLNTTNWTEVSLVPCRLKKITREASQMLRMNRMRRYFPSRHLKDVQWKRSRTTWVISIQRQMLCFRDQEMVKARSSIPQPTKSGFAAHLWVQLRSTTWWKRCQSEQV